MLPSAPDPGTLHSLSRDDRRRFTAAAFCSAAETHDDAERAELLDQVVIANLGVARTIASRYRSRGIALEDLEQVASAALVRAVHRFDITLASDFLAFAVPSIRGEVRRYFRDNGWMVRPPRRVQELQSQVLDARDRLRSESGRPCTESAIAEALDVPVQDVVEALARRGLLLAPLARCAADRGRVHARRRCDLRPTRRRAPGRGRGARDAAPPGPATVRPGPLACSG